MKLELLSKRTEEKMRIAFQNLGLAVWECFFAEKKNVYTPETAERFRIPEVMENVPESLLKLEVLHPQSRDTVMRMYTDVMSGKPNAEEEVALILRDGTIQWLQINMATIYENHIPVSAICTAKNITKEKRLTIQREDEITRRSMYEAVLQAVAKKGYIDIKLIQIADSSYCSYGNPQTNICHMVQQGEHYWLDVQMFLQGCMEPKEFEEIRSKHSVEFILKTLEEEPVVTSIFRVKAPDGSVHTVKTDYSYLNEEKQSILMTTVDITEALQEEISQKQMLESALLAAKQASQAKSDFLSRMSHEIRTPMNAILGMTALASQAVGNEEEIMDCISKIGISGHYLLSLINDILDMSRIESGKMLLHNSAFNFAEFIDEITTVIYGQARQKNIHYETEVAHGLDDGYIGDAMKLQQILINILGNAIKFTQKGGKVTFSISLLARTEKQVKLRFAVNDTGCGIGEEALAHIFDPFEQQDASTTSQYGGSGLGLAIAKSLTELMGGTIRVRSIVNIGSEFTVEVPLEIDQSLTMKKPEQYSFADLHTLIVDDDLIICEQTAQTLKDIGMIPKWVTSGREAIAQVKEWWSRNKNFDFILVDWKMPEMDGLETTREIRRIVGPEVTIIIMTAYDWAAIENQAKAAGVNMCISKPMLKSTLVSAFTKATREVKREEETKLQLDFDFSGKRVLVAEDHPLNAEIAVRLLQKKHFTVEVAENGLKALERFTSTPVGYFDAILMDMRMPIMDGVHATINIRHWEKEDAKTIPIIAMTANAFDEDVEKCKAAGMDSHLAKPIDPDLLYRELYRLIK